MDHAFDLNISNYTTKELLDLIKLPTNVKHEPSIITSNIHELQSRLLSDNSVTEETRDNIIQFLREMERTLLGNTVNDTNPSNEITNFPQIQNELIQQNSQFIIKKHHPLSTDNNTNTFGIIEGTYAAPAGLVNPIKYHTIKKAINSYHANSC